MNKHYTLYVTNIPAELDETAIRELFSDYGKIIDLIYRPTKGWAYITYGSYREAEHTIRNLNKALELKIILLRKPKFSPQEDDAASFTESSNEIYERQNHRSPNTVAESSPVCNDSIYTQKITRGNPLNALRKHNLVPQGTQTTNSNSRSVVSNDKENEHHSSFDVNRLWTRGEVTVTRDGIRRVSFGRGYTSYEFPDEDPNLEGHIDKMHEKRNTGLYEYSEDKLSRGLKSCVLCNTKTVHRCERCYTYYCSKECQVKDWPRHQANCDRIPALIKDKVNDMSPLCIKDENQTQIQSSASNKTVTQTPTLGSVKLRRPNTPNMQTGNSSNTVNANTDKSNAGCLNSNGDNQSRHSLLRTNVNGSQLKQEDQLTNGTRNSSQNWSPKQFDENTDQSKKNTSLSPQNQHNRNYQSNKTANTRTYSNRENIDNDNNMRGRNQFHQKNGYQNGEKSAFHDNRETAKQENNAFTVPRNGQYLSQTKFTKVEITVQLSNDEYWICKDEDLQARTDLMNKLEHLAVKSRNLKPVVGSVYGVLYKDTWHRAMVKSINPIKVHYIDYGNEEILDKNVIFKDIRDLLKISNFAQKIRLTPVNRPNKSLLCKDKISIRMLSVDADDTMVVEMQETKDDMLHATESTAQSSKNTTVKELGSPRNLQVSVSQTSTNKKPESQGNTQVSANINNKAPEMCNILYKFMNGEQLSQLEQSGFIELHEQVENNVYNATLCASSYLMELQTIYEDMQADCEKLKVINYKPQADELICGLEKDSGKGSRWHRGYIYLPNSTPSNIYMRTLDVPKIVKVEKIVQCPKEYQNILTFGVTCITEQSTEFQLEGEVFQIKVINKHAQQMKIKLIPEEKSCIKEEIPAIMKPLSYVTPVVRSELTSGTKVCITHPYNHYVAFVRSMDDEDEKYFLNIMSRVKNCAKTAPFLTKPPNINQIVIAPFIDDNSYRATVVKLLEDDNVLVQYNDFGNIYKLKRQNLQVIPDDLAKEQSCLTKILLKDVPRDVTITEEARIYLQNLADTETPLTYIRSSSSSEEGVYLITATGERINDKIKELLLSKTNNEKKYMLSDIGVARLGSAGNTVNAMVMYIEKPGVSYMLVPSDNTLLAQIDALCSPMAEYCNKTKYYIPKNNELCLALYEKEWYRAVCINSKKSQTASEIFFIDYGNLETVSHRDIREMHEDFMHPPAMATKCEVINLAPVDSTGHPSTAVQNKLAELMDVYKVVQIQIIEITDNVTKIELPEIRAILVKNGLM
ncbi:uncharacterized protein LOC109856278 isoform X2 [Pseudomyrmex gracilis]|nr:uncharacterized protein LOC109856278 isoform X2 [Pseudomyrmex gracilis]XP_020286949.1 uncharacterized protein LOC109856278 isoform X2 [Pseudomyrmex gracilis]